MAFLDKLADVAANLGDMANDTIETTKLNSRISSEKKAIELELAKIGHAYYELYKQGEETREDAQGAFARVDAHYKEIEDIEKTLELYKKPTV